MLPQNYSEQINILHIRKKPLLKKSIEGRKNVAGRNNSGKITVWHKGKGHKKNYWKINFNSLKILKGISCSVEYDPNRNAYIMAVYDIINNTFSYILSPRTSKIGDIIWLKSNMKPKLGHSLPLSHIPIGSYIHNISLCAAKPAQLSWAAGMFSWLKEKTLHFVIIKLNLVKYRSLASNCFASIGVVSNGNIFLKQLTKAGQSRWLNKRPTVWGVAMNPIDHPHGGGEGKKSGKNKTPWGKYNWTKKRN